MTYLLDTNIVSEVRKRVPDVNVLAWYDATPSAELFLSVLTIGEIRMDVERLRQRDTAQADVLEKWLDGLRDTYRERILDVDTNAAEEWGRNNVSDQLPVIDGLLAATARVRGWTLVTRNTAGLVRSGVKLLNPFQPASGQWRAR